jgi:hypothetical protein
VRQDEEYIHARRCTISSAAACRLEKREQKMHNSILLESRSTKFRGLRKNKHLLAVTSSRSRYSAVKIETTVRRRDGRRQVIRFCFGSVRDRFLTSATRLKRRPRIPVGQIWILTASHRHIKEKVYWLDRQSYPQCLISLRSQRMPRSRCTPASSQHL